MLVLISERCLGEHGSHMLSKDLNSNGLDVNTTLTSSPMLMVGTIYTGTECPLQLYLVKKGFLSINHFISKVF